ncbi:MULTISPECIES: protease inhibitor I9 family protein [unclassified Bacillus (in: firmicutes)]|uniref:protease inhibitor I9 family protein n=1 Tax=unclassified Bacillus (in: firmicutes) TaxID=185979 RepID=UPI002034F601|nr:MULTISPECIES: protease inhibitor I9 family protein [unclassified Bacillus (in: firmicutes)]
MMKCYSGAILAVAVLTIMSECQASSFENNFTLDKGKVMEETMTPSVHVDPAIDLSSKQTTSIIIEFKTKPAKVAVIEAEAKGIALTIEEAKEQVEESHQTFQKELHELLDNHQVPYTVRHKYTTAFNGVSMELPANEIKRLAEFSSVISKISLNRKIKLDPPILPSEQL